MGRKTTTPRDLDLEAIDAWAAAIGAAQLATIRANPDMLPDERQAALVEAERWTAATAEQLRYEYRIRQRQAPR